MDKKSDAKPSESKSNRLVSLDALRGFDMFWIMGGGASTVKIAAEMTSWAWLLWISSQLEHPEWHGFAFYDLIFPLFLFIAGVSMPFSFEKRLERGESKASLYRHLIFRAVILILLGVIRGGLLKMDFESLRVASVLGRIGVAYMFAGFIVLNTNVRGQIIWFAGLLVAYWAALKFIPVPGFGAGDLSPGHTLTGYIDRMFMPGVLYKEVRDPEGILATVPAISTALSGVMTGHLLKNKNRSGHMKVAMMVVLGFISLGLSYLWNYEFPINKNLWSSSFVLHCTGWSLLFLSLFYLVIDVWGFKSWAFFFVVIGSNSILIYMAPKFVNFTYTAQKIFGEPGKYGVLKYAGDYGPILFSLGLLLIQWLILYLFYKRKIFFKV